MRIFKLMALSVIPFRLFSQSFYTHYPAESIATGFTGLASSNSTYSFQNPASIADPSGTSIYSSCLNYYGVNGLNGYSAGIALPFQNVGLGAAVSGLGDELYREQRITFLLADRIEHVSVGIRGNYLLATNEGYAPEGIFLLEMGGIIDLHPDFSFGAFINNINQPKIRNSDQRLGTLIGIGVDLHRKEFPQLKAEVVKDMHHPITIKAGIRQVFLKRVSLSTGFNLNPDVFTVGFGFAGKKFSCDYALVVHPVLGLTNSLGLCLVLSKKENEKAAVN
jgi:hypothetical protein